MTTMSDLPEDLTMEIFSRVPLTSLSAVRSTCKRWNSISKSQVLCESAARRKQFLGFMINGFRVCSMKFDLQGIQSEEYFDDPSIKEVSVLDQFEISQIFQCEGLLLCVANDMSRLLVWNPYLGQMRWIQLDIKRADKYALGYDKNRNHKILGIFDEYDWTTHDMVFGYTIFDLSSNTCKVCYVNPDWYIPCYQRGVSLKGTTYFLAREGGGKSSYYILPFNYTTERFGKLLPLPFNSENPGVYGHLSCVREEQLVVLYGSYVPGYSIEIWVTNKIDPGAGSWSKFLSITIGCAVSIHAGSFFIDEEKRVAVVWERNQTAKIIGQDGYSKSVNMEEKCNRPGQGPPHVCPSYVPSSVQLQTNQTNGKKVKK